MQKIRKVAIVMDGNGRWAQKRFRPRVWGHIRGAHNVSKVVEHASDLGLESLTLYAFSTENWSRPAAEVKSLFRLLDKFLIKEKKKILENNIRFNIIGEYQFLSKSTVSKIRELKELTVNATGLSLNFAFGYGGRKEIVEAVNSYIKKNPGKEITEELLENNLYSQNLSEVDLLIRTGGDQRVSNFLLWQIAYAELYFSKTYWPDFTVKEFSQILQATENRERRFGAVKEEFDHQTCQKQRLNAERKKKEFLKEENQVEF